MALVSSKNASLPALRPAGPSNLKALLIFPVLAAGCARFQTLGLPDLPAHARPNYQEKSGLTLAAELIADPQIIDFYFGAPLRKKGFIPVVVAIENRGDRAVVINRVNFKLVLENGERFEPVPPRDVFEESKRSQLLTVVLAPLVLPAILSHERIDEYNLEMAQSLFARSYPGAMRIEARDPSLARALFFRDPTGRTRLPRDFSSAVLQAVVEVEGSRPAAGDRSSAPEASDTRPPASGTVIGKLESFTISLRPEGIQ